MEPQPAPANLLRLRRMGIDTCQEPVLYMLAKLAGAPKAASAGIDLHVRLGDFVERRQPLFTLHAGSPRNPGLRVRLRPVAA
jgi:thymidine phosphorylase